MCTEYIYDFYFLDGVSGGSRGMKGGRGGGTNWRVG